MAPEKFAFSLGERFVMALGDGEALFTVVDRGHTKRGNIYWLEVLDGEREAEGYEGATQLVEEHYLETLQKFEELTQSW